MEASSNPHASGAYATTTPEAVTQKNREHVKYLNKRMVETRKARRTDLRVWSYSNKTQKIKNQKQSDRKAFCRLMLHGQVKKALRFVDNTNDNNGKHDITTDIKKKLKEKHPKAAELKQSAIIDEPETKTERVIFENITQGEIASNAKNTSGSGGQTQIDMGTWREMICPKSYGTHSQNLADEIATLARHLATDTIPHDYVSTLLTCRLVPLKKKDNGIRPVGVGECLWQIIGKTITGLLKEDIIRAVGTLQTCAGLESGTEAATQAITKSYEEENSECLLLVDADNAFNRLNRKINLENIKHCVPPCTNTYTTATIHPPCYILKMGTSHTVTGGCDTRGQCSNGNVRLTHTTTDTNTEQWNCKWWSETGMVCRW